MVIPILSGSVIRDTYKVIFSNSPDKDLYGPPFGKTLCVISYFQTYQYIEKALEAF